MDACIKKPLIATSSIDKSIRIWLIYFIFLFLIKRNYVDNQLELVGQFEDEAYTVAFHPSGFHLIAAFNDKILMLNIFEKELLPFKEIHIKVKLSFFQSTKTLGLQGNTIFARRPFVCYC